MWSAIKVLARFWKTNKNSSLTHGVFAIYERNRYATTIMHLSHTPLWSFADDVEELQPAALPVVGQHLELDEPPGQGGEGEGLEGQGVGLLPGVLQTGVQHRSPGAIRTLNTANRYVKKAQSKIKIRY